MPACIPRALYKWITSRLLWSAAPEKSCSKPCCLTDGMLSYQKVLFMGSRAERRWQNHSSSARDKLRYESWQGSCSRLESTVSAEACTAAQLTFYHQRGRTTGVRPVSSGTLGGGLKQAAEFQLWKSHDKKPANAERSVTQEGSASRPFDHFA